MTCHYPDLGSASDWSCHKDNVFQPIRSHTQIWRVTYRQYGISVLIPHFQVILRETSDSISKSQLFTKALLKQD